LTYQTIGQEASLKHVQLYTDGACSGNPGPGGYGAVLLFGEKRKELTEGFRRTTNNRMEMLAAIKGLEALRYPCKVTLYTDSQYLANGIVKGWARGWKAKGWIKSDKQPAVNVDLWERILQLCDMHQIDVVWVKGHAGNPENERCDQLSVGSSKSSDLLIDEEYERNNRRG
jgi:ribonuclease HI